MFIYSLRASTLKFIGIVGVALIALVALIVFIPSDRPAAPSSALTQTVSYRYEKIKTPEDRVEFLKQFGWEVKSEPIEETKVTIPAEFDKVFAGYNEIQKNQGLDLSRYKNKEVMRYTYEVTNYRTTMAGCWPMFWFTATGSSAEIFAHQMYTGSSTVSRKNKGRGERLLSPRIHLRRR